MKELASGAFGDVYKASKDSQEFAIKVIKCKTLNSIKTAQTENSFFGKRLNHPFLVQYFETFFIESTKSDLFALVMELCPRGDLDGIIDVINPSESVYLSEKRFMKIAIQLVLAVKYLHHNNILHRDIKTGNVFVDAQDNVKLGDFGCGKFLDEAVATTLIGTILYMAPEVFKGASYSFPADVWSLGVLFYHLASGKFPFHGNRNETIQLIMKGKFAPLSDEVCSPELSSIINQMICLEPAKRIKLDQILVNPYIQTFAEKLNLKKYF